MNPYSIRDEEVFSSDSLENGHFRTQIIHSGASWAENIMEGLQQIPRTLESDADLYRLFEDAERLSGFAPRDTRTIAILGDTGEGL